MTQPAEDAFRQGDFQTAARLTENPVLKGLAQIMIGNPLDGLPELAGLDPADPSVSSETVSILAFGHWLAGNTDTARTILSARRDDPLIAAFLNLLSNGPIPCLFQSARAPLLTAMKQVEGFAVTTVGSGGQACDFDLDDCDRPGLARARNEAAFLFGFDFAGPPPDRPADCRTPYLIHLTDPDVHVLTGLQPIRRYDRALAGTSGQAAAITAITGVKAVSAPFLGGLSAFHPSLIDHVAPNAPNRNTDLFFSGSYGTPIYHEKPARFFAISQIPAPYRIELFDSTRPLSDYAASLQAAKFALVSVRAPGSFSTRAMQALECGAFVLCETESGVLDYFPGEDWGVFTYRPDRIAEDIAGHLTRYDAYAERLRPRAGAIRERLAALSPGSPLAEQNWLKYAAFQALQIRHSGKVANRTDCVAPPLDWFTVRGIPSPILGSPAGDRAAAYSALAVDARDSGQPPEDWLADDGAFTPLDAPRGRIPPLNPDLCGAFLRLAKAWTDRDRTGFETAAEAIWLNRDNYTGQCLNGLAVPDFWLGVFLNRLGLSLGRLFEDAVTARMEKISGNEAAQLVASLGMAASERAWTDGDHAGAAERAVEVLALDPANHAARTLTVITDLAAGRAVEDAHLHCLSDYPWHLPRLLPLLTGRDDLDRQIAGGELHCIYLRFIQRMRDSRPLLSPKSVPAGAATYLAWKLELDASATPEKVLETLRRSGLMLTDDRTVSTLIAEPTLSTLRR